MSRLLTRPTPARQDAPFRRQGRNEKPFRFLIPYLKGSGRGCPVLRATSDHISIMILPSSLVFSLGMGAD
jgi:hypothetical protein